MSSHPRHKTKEELDPVKDASFIARIEHSKTCDNWSVIENCCGGHTCKCGRQWIGSTICDKCFEEKLEKVDRDYLNYKENN